MVKAEPTKAVYADVCKVQTGQADWNSASVHYPDLITGKPRLIGKVYVVHGRTWHEGRERFWSNSLGDFEFHASSAAIALANHYVRTRKVPRYL